MEKDVEILSNWSLISPPACVEPCRRRGSRHNDIDDDNAADDEDTDHDNDADADADEKKTKTD